MIVKFDVIWICNGFHRVDVIEADDIETALEKIDQLTGGAQEHRVISIRRVGGSASNRGDTIDMAPVSA